MIYARTPASETPSVIGTTSSSGTRILEGAEGNGSYGPYGSLDAGRWFAGFHVRALENATGPEALLVDVCHNQGSEKLGAAWFGAEDLCMSSASLIGVQFEVHNRVSDYELRLYFAGSGKFEVVDKIVFRTDLA